MGLDEYYGPVREVKDVKRGLKAGLFHRAVLGEPSLSIQDYRNDLCKRCEAGHFLHKTVLGEPSLSYQDYKNAL